MAVAIERRSQRAIDARNHCADVVEGSHVMLRDGEFIAAETRDEILRPHRLAQPLGNSPEVFVADRMSERVVDALEFVNVDIEDREPDATGFEQQSLRMTLKQGS